LFPKNLELPQRYAGKQKQQIASDEDRAAFSERHQDEFGTELESIRSKTLKGSIVLENTSFGWSESS
jgi:hypothetical protein